MAELCPLEGRARKWQLAFFQNNRPEPPPPLKCPAGGSEVDFHFFIVSNRRECQLPRTFFEMKKYYSSPKLSHFEIAKIHTITFSYSLSDGILILGSDVLKLNTKLLINQIFDLGLISENIEFWKCPPCQKSSKIKISNLKILYFHFWGLNQKFCIHPKNITTKYQDSISKTVVGDRFLS